MSLGGNSPRGGIVRWGGSPDTHRDVLSGKIALVSPKSYSS